MSSVDDRVVMTPVVRLVIFICWLVICMPLIPTGGVTAICVAVWRVLPVSRSEHAASTLSAMM